MKHLTPITAMVALLVAISILCAVGSQQELRAQTPATKPAAKLNWWSIMAYSPVTANSLATGAPLLACDFVGDRRNTGLPQPEPGALEVRSADNRRRLMVIPDPFPNRPRDGTQPPGVLVAPLFDGDYLLALTDGHDARCSNVATLKIDSKFDPASTNGPPLRLIPVPIAPDEVLPSVWLVATGPTPANPKFTNDRVPFPDLTIDGVQHSSPGEFWVGPAGPLKPGQRDMRLIHLDEYAPGLAAKAQYKVKAQILDYVADEVTIPADDTLGRAWDKATPAITTEPSGR
jgi:hypothetical protein